MKTCSKCHLPQSEDQFHSKGKGRGLRADCKSCIHKRHHSPAYVARRAAYSVSERAKTVRAIYEASEQGQQKRKEYHASERGKALKKVYAATEAGKAAFRKSHRAYQKSEVGMAAIRAADRKRYAENVQFKVAQRLRSRVRCWLRDPKNRVSAIDNLGCSVESLVKHLEGQFRDGMSWANYGSWHIDHIRPLASFDLTDKEQIISACHFTNLRPLWASENQSKGSRLAA